MPRLSPAQKNYAMAKAYHDTITDIVNRCKTKVLTENEFYSTEHITLERITKPGQSYLMNDADADKYWRLCFAEYQKHGIAPKDYQTAPAYEAWELLQQAEKELIEWGFTIIKKDPRYLKAIGDIEKLKDIITYRLDIRDQLIDLTMRVSA